MSGSQKAGHSLKPMPWYFDPADPRLTEEQRRRAEEVANRYLTEDTELFPVETLNKISRILRDHRQGRWVPVIDLDDYVDGCNRPYSITLDLGPEGNTLKRLNYVPVQRLMNPHWHKRRDQLEDSNAEPLNPLQVVSKSYETLGQDELSKKEFDEWLSAANDEWVDCKIWETIQQTFAAIPDANLPHIDKIIAFEIGSMWRAYAWNKPYEHRQEPLEDRVWQHALVKALGDYLRRRTGHDVQVYIQDPTYTQEDLEYLHNLGIKPLEEPTGFTEIDIHTFVYSINAPIPVMQITADMGNSPAMILWRELVEHEIWFRPDNYPGDYLSVKSDPTSPRVEWLLQNYQSHVLEDIGGFLFGKRHTRLYVRKQK